MKSLFIYYFFIIGFLFISNSTSGQTLTKYAKQFKAELAEKNRIEEKKYQDVCKTASLSAFNEYLNKYPNGKYVSDIKNRIVDYSLWQDAKKQNTKTSYETYLEKSKFQSFKDEVYAAITELNSISEWDSLKSSNDVFQIQKYILKFPISSRVKAANNRIHELNGVSYYKKQNYSSAYSEFKEAGGRSYLENSNMSLYDECEEHIRFASLSSNSSENDLYSFINMYPNSQYYNNVSNWIALVKAKNLTVFSDKSTRDLALSYAKDDYTRNTVKSYIALNKRNRRLLDGGLFNFGIELMDFGFNSKSSDDYNSNFDIVGFYNVGLSLKIGNYESPVQLELGIKPGFVFYTDLYNYGDETQNNFHIPIYTRLKINLFNVSSSKFYISGTAYYNALIEDFLENDYSLAYGTGFAWRHWDWYLYYKHDIKIKNGLNNQIFGTSFVYYF